MNWELPNSLQLSNFALGIVGEFGEITEILEVLTSDQKEIDRVIDEAGDVFWYVSNLATYLDLDFRELFPTGNVRRVTIGTAIQKGFQHTAKIADSIKKTIAQGHELNREGITANLKGLMDYLNSILVIYYAVHPQEVCAYNHKKLLKRYPDGFEAEKSVNREA
jgi:hypothetical protein